MTSVQIMETIRNALAADSALLAWSQAQFGKLPTIYLGIDERKPPPADEFPIVSLTGITFLQGEGAREIVGQIDLGVGVLQEEIISSGQMRTFKGLLQAEELRALAEDTLYRLKLPGALDSRAETAAVSAYPLFISYSILTLSSLKTTRRALPA